jgi:predicted enzyme related to lactoylglutathione lyase
MASGFSTILFPVSDLAAAKPIYTKLLGVEPMADSAYYVGYQVGEQHIGLVPQAQDKGQSGSVPYWMVADINAALAELEALGAEIREPATEVGPGRVVATVKDADGNVIGLMQDS